MEYIPNFETEKKMHLQANQKRRMSTMCIVCFLTTDNGKRSLAKVGVGSKFVDQRVKDGRAFQKNNCVGQWGSAIPK